MLYDSLSQYGSPNALGLPQLNLNFGLDGQPTSAPGVNGYPGSAFLNYGNPTPLSPTAAPQKGFFDGLVGTAENPGYGGLALGAASGLLNGFLGLQQYGIAKDTLRENKRQFSLNFDAQRKTTNAALEDRQRRRVAERPDFAEPVDQYLAKYGI